MASIPLFQIGQDLISMTIDTVTVGATGTLTDDVAVTTVTGTIQEIGIAPEAVLEEISPMNATQRNHVKIIDDISYTLSVLKVNDGTDPNPLFAKFLTKDIFKLVWTEGTGASATVNTAYVIRQAWADGLSGKGQQIGTFTFAQIDAGASSFTRV